MNVAEKIKALREARGISQDALAQIIGVDRTTIVKYESGASKPTRNLKKLADYFHVTTDELLGRPAPKPGYYLDEETARIANEMKDRPELKTLFDASRRLRPEDISEVDALIQAKLKRPEYDEMGDGDFSE